MGKLLSKPVPARVRIPRLHPGDRLTKAEFVRRFDAMPELTKAELIDGEVYMAPIAHVGHSREHTRLVWVFTSYIALTPGTDAGDNGSLQIESLDSMPQPDCFLRVRTECGGQTTIDAKGFVVGAPELIGEISSSSASYDLHKKKDLYRREGVKEYIVWRTEEDAIDRFVLRRKKYILVPADADGILRSVSFPGLWIDVPALLRDELPTVLTTIQLGLATPEHATFVAALDYRPAR